MGQPRWSSPGHNRTHIGVCLLDTNRFAVLARLLLDGSATPDAARASVGYGVALTARQPRFPAFVSVVFTSMPAGGSSPPLHKTP
jgi:hypothetical protein